MGFSLFSLVETHPPVAICLFVCFPHPCFCHGFVKSGKFDVFMKNSFGNWGFLLTQLPFGCLFVSPFVECSKFDVFMKNPFGNWVFFVDYAVSICVVCSQF